MILFEHRSPSLNRLVDLLLVFLYAYPSSGGRFYSFERSPHEVVVIDEFVVLAISKSRRRAFTPQHAVVVFPFELRGPTPLSRSEHVDASSMASPTMRESALFLTPSCSGVGCRSARFLNSGLRRGRTSKSQYSFEDDPPFPAGRLRRAGCGSPHFHLLAYADGEIFEVDKTAIMVCADAGACTNTSI